MSNLDRSGDSLLHLEANSPNSTVVEVSIVVSSIHITIDVNNEVTLM